jgi:hypothetical protein
MPAATEVAPGILVTLERWPGNRASLHFVYVFVFYVLEFSPAH